MFSPDLVRANVVDIRSFSSTLPKKNVVVDANILYFVHYDPANLISAGGRPPAHYQSTAYPKWWRRAVEAGVSLSTTTSSLAEFSHIAERTELEVRWRTDPSEPELDPDNPGQPYSPKYAKRVRQLYSGELGVIRSDIETMIQSVQKSVELLPRVGSEPDLFSAVIRDWLSSSSDISDAILVTAAKRAGVPRVVSDDADLITFEGITVYTANRNAIDAASTAGMLVT